MALKGPLKLGVPNSSVEVSESVRPHGNFRPAPWLPIVRQDNRSEDFIVMYSGAPVTTVSPIDGNDQFADVIPAGYATAARVAAARAATDPAVTVFTYSQLDIDYGVIDVRTGSAVVAATAVTDADLVNAGLNIEDAYFVGVLTHNALVWAGGDGDTGLIFDNYNKQSRVTITSDYLIEVPVVAGVLTEVELTSINNVAQTATLTGMPTINDYADATAYAANTVVTDGTTGGIYYTPTGGTSNGATLPADADVYWVPYTGITIVDADGTSYQDRVITIDATGFTLTAPALAAGLELTVTYPTSTLQTPLLPGVPVLTPGASTVRVPNGAFVSVNTSNQFEVYVGTDPKEIAGQITSVNRQISDDLLNRVRTFYSSGIINTMLSGVDARLLARAGSTTGGLSQNAYRALATVFNGVARINILR